MTEVAVVEDRRGGEGGFRDMIIGAFFFSLMTLFVKLVGPRVSNQEIVLFRGVLTLGISYAMVRAAGVSPFGGRRGLLILRGLLGFGALTFMYYALVHLPLADATVLQYLNPLWAAVLGAFFLGERLHRHEWFLVAGSMLGVIAIARPQFLFGDVAGAVDPIAVISGMTGGALSGAAYAVIRELARTEHPLVIVFYFPLVTVPAALPGALATWTMPHGIDWFFLIGAALTAQAGQIFITSGLKKEAAGRATAMAYLQVVFAAVWGIVFFAEIPDVWTISGAFIILACTVGMALSRRIQPPPSDEF